MPLNFAPEAMVEGGGLVNDEDLTVTSDSIFCLWDYQGKSKTTFAAKLVLEDDAGEKYEQYYSGGDPEGLEISDDGLTVEPVGEKTGIVRTTNFGLLSEELFRIGFFKKGDVFDSMAQLHGHSFHWLRKPQPKRTGLVNPEGGNQREREILLPVKYLGTKGAAKSGKKAAATKGVGSTKPAAASSASVSSAASANGDAAQEVESAALTLLAEGPIERRQFAVKVFQSMPADHPFKKQALAIASAKAFIEGGPWVVEGTTISLPTE